MIIGIEEYERLARVPGATDNALAWFDYLKSSRGVPAERIHLLQNAEATEFQIEDAVKAASQEAGPGGKLWIVFIGHGAPNQNQEPLLVGYGAQLTVSGLERRSLRQADVLAMLRTSQATPVVLFDACFSGRTEKGEALVPGLQPSLVMKSVTSPENAIILSAAGSDEFAGPLPGAERPAFSYLALGALRGWADEDQNGIVTALEVRNYTEDVLSRFLRGERSQSPTVTGRTDFALSTARDPSPDINSFVQRYRGNKAALSPQCPKGTIWSTEAAGCVGSKVVCVSGTSWDEPARACVAGGVLCPEGSRWSDGVKACLAGTQVVEALDRSWTVDVEQLNPSEFTRGFEGLSRASGKEAAKSLVAQEKLAAAKQRLEDEGFLPADLSVGSKTYTGTVVEAMRDYSRDAKRVRVEFDNLQATMDSGPPDANVAIEGTMLQGKGYFAIASWLADSKPRLFSTHQEKALKQAEESDSPELKEKATAIRKMVIDAWEKKRSQELTSAFGIYLDRFIWAYELTFRFSSCDPKLRVELESLLSRVFKEARGAQAFVPPNAHNTQNFLQQLQRENIRP